MSKKERFSNRISSIRIPLSSVMTGLVVFLVLIACISAVSIFTSIYSNSIEQNAITNSDQVVSLAENMVSNYIEDMSGILEMASINIANSVEERDDFFNNLLNIRKDVEAITVHSPDGVLVAFWSGRNELKSDGSISWNPDIQDGVLFISAPHVQNMFKNYYPWVVTFSKKTAEEEAPSMLVSVDIRFSNIAQYMDAVGIGTHGYCYIADKDGSIVYHPQQQLINAGLKEERSENIRDLKDGSHMVNDVIYTIHSLDNCDWRIVGVSYVDELIEAKTSSLTRAVIFVGLMVILATALAGTMLARSFSRPAEKLAAAMRRFVREAEDYEFYPVKGTEEIEALSDSFGHMVLKLQELMDKVRHEEVTLRKTELNALQAQINPHFLYNTLDSIGWMCEVGRTGEAIEMVNALARLFRISISKGHALITIEQELQHAECYLKIQKFRYKSQFDYKFLINENCLKYYCNKITLQPMIENAIVHGLDMSEEGEIAIEVYEKDDDIVMAISDNGIGMTKEQCDEILRNDRHTNGGIGIKNVNDRIKIYFGEKYGITIISTPDEGTRVEILIPKVSEDDYEI